MKFITICMVVFGLCSSVQAACTVSFTVENNTTAPVNVGQSWTATCTGMLTSITVKADTPNAGLTTVKIFNGQSVAPVDLLRVRTGAPALIHGLNTLALAPVSVTNGAQYTFLLTNESGNGLKLRYDTTNGYAGGLATAGAGFVAGSDIYFSAAISDPIPSLSEWGIILFMLLILATAIPRLKKRSS